MALSIYLLPSLLQTVQAQWVVDSSSIAQASYIDVSGSGNQGDVTWATSTAGGYSVTVTNRSISILADVSAEASVSVIGSSGGMDQAHALTSAQGSATWNWAGPPGGDPNSVTVTLSADLNAEVTTWGTFFVQFPGSTTCWSWGEVSTTIRGGPHAAFADVYSYSEDGLAPDVYLCRANVFYQDYSYSAYVGETEASGYSASEIEFGFDFADNYVISPGATSIFASAHANADAVAFASGATSGGRIQTGTSSSASCFGGVSVSF